MATFGTAHLTDEIPAPRAISAVIAREEILGAVQDPERSPELYLDVDRRSEDGGEERSTIGISWSRDELERLLEHSSGDNIILTFDRDELQYAFDDVEAHGLRERALVFAVVAAGAIGSGATIANAAPILETGASGPAPVAALNVHTPGVQLGDGGSTSVAPSALAAAADSVVANAVAQSADAGVVSNVHTPGLQVGDGGATAAPSLQVSAAGSVAADSSPAVSNAHRPGLQLGAEGSTGTTRSVQAPATSSSGEFLGITSQDVTDGLIAGGVLLAIAGATFAGTRRTGTARPA